MSTVFHSPSPAKIYLLASGEETTLATVVRGYGGTYEPSISEEEVEGFLKDLQATKLQTPAGFINLVWLIKNVSRSFCAQLTRSRIGVAFVQESLRFSEKRNAEFYVPDALTRDQRAAFEHSCVQSVETYNRMLELGAEVQNARGVLPLAVLTHVFASINLQTLAAIYGARSCCQAQGYKDGEWETVLSQMKDLLSENHPGLASFLKAPWENPTCVDCSFHASFDRPCKEQHRFNVNLRKLAEERLT